VDTLDTNIFRVGRAHTHTLHRHEYIHGVLKEFTNKKKLGWL